MSQTILEEAANIIDGARHDTYGDAGDEFINIAKIWTLYLGGRTEVSPQDFVNMMILLKVFRARHGYHRDSYVDICGYSALAERVQNRLETEKSQKFLLDALKDADWSKATTVPQSGWGFINTRMDNTVTINNANLDEFKDAEHIDILVHGGGGSGKYPDEYTAWPVGTVKSGVIDTKTEMASLGEAETDRKWISKLSKLVYWFVDGEWWIAREANLTNPTIEDPWVKSGCAVGKTVSSTLGPFEVYTGLC